MHELLRLARADYKAYEGLIKSDDELVANIAHYHMQQAIEKLLKCALELKGEKPRWTHDIRELYAAYIKVGWPAMEEIRSIQDTITLWESRARYNTNFLADQEDLVTAKCGFLKLEGELNTYLLKLNKINEEQKEEIDEVLPKLD